MASRRLTLLQLLQFLQLVVLTISVPHRVWAVEVTSSKTLPKTLPNTVPKTLTVQRFEIVGSTVFQPWELANVTQPFEEQVLSIEGLQKAADAVTRYYADHGYLTSRAVLSDQTIEGGTVQIRVVEGSLETLTIEGTKGVPQRYLRNRIALAGLKPFNQEHLEYELRQLRSDPLFSTLEATIKEGSSVGKSVMTLTVKEAPSLIGSASLNNHGSKTVGKQQVALTGGIQSFAGYADLLTLSQVRSMTGGTSAFQASYQFPLNAKQGSVSLQLAKTSYQVTEPQLRDLGITGESMMYDITLRQPVLRSLKNEMAVSLGVIHRSGRAIVGDILTSSTSSTVLRFGQDWVHREVGGYWIGNSQFDVGLSRSDQDSDRANPFVVWSGAVQRVHSVSKSSTLITSANWQFTPNHLPGSQQFSVGGSQVLRGFPGGLFNGDNGVTVSIENRLTMMRRKSGEALLQVSPYVETGRVWSQPSVGRSKSVGLLWSAGLGINWQVMPGWGMRLDAAIPIASGGKMLGNLSLYFSSSYRF